MNANSTTTEAFRSDAWDGLVPGALLGDCYRLVRHLAKGGMGDVYLASHERLHNQFVVKVPSPETAADPDAIARFRHEAELMIAARHPNVVQVVDFNVTADGLPYLVMEYLPGEDLGQLLATRGSLSAAEIVSIVRQIACALDSAHARGIVHRDLKPENIMMVPCSGQPDVVKIIDFGISKANQSCDEPDSWTLAGTPEFMSPEQIQCQKKDVDGRSDQFSLAVIVYMMLTGRTPWGTKDPTEALSCVMNGDALPLVDGFPWRWHTVQAVLAKGMAYLAADRYQSMLDFSDALTGAMLADGMLSGRSHSASPATTNRKNVPPSQRRRSSVEHDGVSEKMRVGSHSRCVTRVGTSPPRSRHRGQVRNFGMDGALVLAAVFFGIWMGEVDVPAARGHAARGWQSLEHVGKIARSGQDSIAKLWTSAAADLAPWARN